MLSSGQSEFHAWVPYDGRRVSNSHKTTPWFQKYDPHIDNTSQNFHSLVPRQRDAGYAGYQWLFREGTLLFFREETLESYPNPRSFLVRMYIWTTPSGFHRLYMYICNNSYYEKGHEFERVGESKKESKGER